MNIVVWVIVSNILTLIATAIAMGASIAGVGWAKLMALIAVLPSVIISYFIGKRRPEKWLFSLLTNLVASFVFLMYFFTALADLKYPSQGPGELLFSLVFLVLAVLPWISGYIGKNIANKNQQQIVVNQDVSH